MKVWLSLSPEEAAALEHLLYVRSMDDAEVDQHLHTILPRLQQLRAQQAAVPAKPANKPTGKPKSVVAKWKKPMANGSPVPWATLSLYGTGRLVQENTLGKSHVIKRKTTLEEAEAWARQNGFQRMGKIPSQATPTLATPKPDRSPHDASEKG